MEIKLLCRNKWPAGRLLAFSGLDGPTDFQHGLTARTAWGEPSLEIKWPGACGVRFPGFEGGSFLISGDFFELSKAGNILRGAFVDAYHLLIEGPANIDNCQKTISCHRQGNRLLVAPTGRLDTSKAELNMDEMIMQRSSWLKTKTIPANLPVLTQQTLAGAYSIMKTQVSAPEGIIRHRWTTPDRWPHRAMWLWDSVFHAIGWRHLEIEMACDAIAAMIDAQHPDGFIPIKASPCQNNDNNTQPPLLALGVKLIHDLQPGLAWLRELYPRLCAYVEWDLKNRDRDGAGLVEWTIEGNVNCRSGESGMDNSPRFDAGSKLDAVDFNSFLASECEILSDFAQRLDLPHETERWKEKARQLKALINRFLWNEEKDFYFDYDPEQKTHSPVFASAGFMPLICGAATRVQAEKLARHYKNPDMFGTPFPLPSIAVRDSRYYAKDMWRGPVWVNINWLAAYGFNRCGFADIAADIVEKTTSELEKFYDKYGTLFEFYDDRQELDPPLLNRKGKCAPEQSPFHQVFFDYGWTAALYVDMVFTN